jgi:hypothetical protein
VISLGWLTDLGIALARAGAPTWDDAALATAIALAVVAGAIHVGRAVVVEGRRRGVAFAVAPTGAHRASVSGDLRASSPAAPLTYLLSVVRR